jgi:hypothetical protein
VGSNKASRLDGYLLLRKRMASALRAARPAELVVVVTIWASHLARPWPGAIRGALTSDPEPQAVRFEGC